MFVSSWGRKLSVLQRECEPLLFSSRYFILKTEATPLIRSTVDTVAFRFENRKVRLLGGCLCHKR